MRRLRELRAAKQTADAADARTVDVFGLLGFTPNPGPQTTFLKLPDENCDTMYGGAAGGSKSTSLFMYGMRCCVRYPGLQAFWFRRSFPELEQSVLRMLMRYNYGRALGCRWNGSTHELRFPGGSILTFSHAKNEQEATALQSAEINLLLVDERTTIPPRVVEFLYTRVRSGVAGVPCLGIRSATNPGGVGHAQVRRDYVDATDHGAHTITDNAGRTVRFIQAHASDTPQLGAEYERTLDGIGDPELRKAMRDGSWDVWPNQMFGEFSHQKHVVPAAVELPESWLRYAGLDYGWTAPSAYLLAARDGDGRVWLYRELTMYQTPEREQARRVLQTEAGHPPVIRAADPAMWGKSGSAQPPAMQYAIEGAALRKADNDRLSGWSRLHTYLADAPACAYHRDIGWDMCPMLHIIDGACPELVRTLPSLPRDNNRPEDVDCFIAGTLVSTPSGSRPVESLNVGDLVDTPIGPQPVIASGVSGDGPLMRVELSNGETLTGTPDHCVVTHNRGLVSLAELTTSDILAVKITVEGTSWSSRSGTTRSHTEGKRAGTTTTPTEATWRRDTRRFIDRCTSIITGRSRLDTMFIIGTMTTTTMIQAIWWQLILATTRGIISNLGGRTLSSEQPCMPGITPMRAAPNCRPTSRRPVPTHQRLSTRAAIVDWLALPERADHECIARTPASMHGNERMQIFASARSAVLHSVEKGGNRNRRRLVRINAAGSCVGNGAVYKLTVDTCALYYANGVLVTNTNADDHHADALRYLCMAVGAVSSLLLDADTRDPVVPVEQLTTPIGAHGWGAEPDPDVGKTARAPWATT